MVLILFLTSVSAKLWNVLFYFIRTDYVNPGFRLAFGRSWLFNAFWYRPRLPVRHWGRDMSAPKPYVTDPTPTHSSRPPLSWRFNVGFGSLKYWREKSFYLSSGKHWSRAIQNVRRRSAKGNIKTNKLSFILNFRVITRANIFQTLHLQLKYIVHTAR